MTQQPFAKWLSWVKAAVQEIHQEPSGEIILENTRGSIPLEKRRFTNLYPSRLKRKVAVVDGGMQQYSGPPLWWLLF